jgi:hypothetical protein
MKRLIGLLLVGASMLVAVPAASAAGEALSQNWSGYTVGGDASTAQFSSVSGSWVQPSADCTSGDGYSAFWVGLGGAGGAGGQSQSLEQIGTQANCVGGQRQSYAWYELVPSAPVKLDTPISPGDHVAAKVTVNGTNVTVALSDLTTGAVATKSLQMDQPDTSSAEWIAEAPSSCDNAGNCQPLTLANFGTVQFTGASATTADGHTGSISDPSWTSQAVRLNGSNNGPGYAPAALRNGTSSPDAVPSQLSSDGSSFSVSTQTTVTQAPTDYGNYGDGGYGGSGYGGGYGGGGYGGYDGYGYGY